MRSRILPLALAGTALLVAGALARAETVDLKTGGTLDGEVSLGEGNAVVVLARFPRSGTITIRRSDLTPQSLYRVLERRADPKDPAAHRRLGAIAEEAGLWGTAISEYRAAKDLDPASAREMDGHVDRLTGTLAAEVLQDARDLLDEGRANAAVMHLHTLMETYPGTKAAKEAVRLLPAATKAAGPSIDVAPRTVDASAAARTLETVEAHVGKGDAATKEVAGHEGSVADSRASERAVGHFEAAWETAKTLPVETGDDGLDARIAGMRARAKASLVQAYLTAGTVHLQRRALPDAERWCNRACELDPGNKPNHALHGLILQAKALSIGRGFGGGRRIVKTPATAEDAVTMTKPSEDYPLKTCVVSGEDLGSMGDPIAFMYDGTEVQICCKGCMKKFLADPPKFLRMVREAKAAGR
jgi:tetratricopeptide (TPR) repeat protein